MSYLLSNKGTSIPYRFRLPYFKENDKLYIFLQKHNSKIRLNMACKWLTVFLTDLNYNATKYKQNILCPESEVIGSDDSAINQNYFEPIQFLEMTSNLYDVSLMATFL